MLRKLYITLICLLTFDCYGQTILNGRVVSQANESLSGVSVTVKAKSHFAILAFAITDKAGFFSISFENPQSDSFELRASLLGYKEQVIYFKPGNENKFSIILSPETITLPEVKIKTTPIWLKKDTLNYAVSEFMQKQDRVIGEIIARMPGIEVTPDGQIKYNGKPINKYYIEGLDLLEDKYGLANSNIPANSVEIIQVFENHQPIRILDSISYSDRAALNLKLKTAAKAKLIGRAGLGAGISQRIGEAEFTPMMFKKKYQYIASYKFNNTGKDILKELAPKNMTATNNLIENGMVKKDMMFVNMMPTPGLSSSRYFFNKTHTASFNLLLPLKNPDWQFRVNSSFINHKLKQETSLNSRIYLVNDTIEIAEQNENKTDLNKGQLDVTLTANTSTFYFRNNTEFQGWWSKEQGSIVGSVAIDQILKNPFYILVNNFTLIKIKAKTVYEFSSNTGYSSMPQQLKIFPGIYQNVLNNNVPYEVLLQHAGLRTTYTDNYFSLKKKKGYVTTSFKVGANFKKQTFSSKLFLIENGQEKLITDSFYNNLSGVRFKSYAEAMLFYQKGNLKLSITAPVQYNYFDFNDSIQKTDFGTHKFLFLPSTNIIVDVSPKWSFSTTMSIQTSFSDINSMAIGYMLKTYRNMSRGNSNLQEINFAALTGSFTYRDPLRFIFWTSGITISNNKSNILSNQVFINTLETMTAEKMLNNTNASSLFGTASKYFLNLKTTFGAFFNYAMQNVLQVQNNTVVTFKNRALNFGFNVHGKINKHATFEYANNYKIHNTISQLAPVSGKIYLFFQTLSFNYFFNNFLTLQFKGEHFQVNNNQFKMTNFFFFDFCVRYLTKKKLALDFEIQNISNSRTYAISYLYSNLLTTSLFKLRPRQIIIRFSFPF